MSFLDTILRAKAYLEHQGRVSQHALRREFALDEETLEELVEELVDIQHVAARDGKALVWVGAATRDLRDDVGAAARGSGATAAADGERRQLTVMFCDLVGSTDLSQRLDAEDLRSVVRAYQEAAAQAIDRYAGHIAQYLGDGLLVYFGYPQAHEDDAERAVRAGREILTALAALNERLEREHGLRLAARVGIHTGPVVIGEMGGGARSEVLALGETTHIAARLEALAASDSVVISGATQRLVPGMFLLQDLGTPPLKGVATPPRAYAVLQATGVRSRLDVDPSTLTPLVGRDQELGLLIERWEQAQERDGQAVLIAGDAGLGKSRLLQAFRERLVDTPHTWLECRCTSYTQGSAFHPLVELVEQGLGFRPDDDPEAKLRRLEAAIADAEVSARSAVPLIAALLSLPLPERYRPLKESPELQRKQTMEALVAWTLALAEQQPLVLLFEDLHWCDPSTVELLGLLLAQSPTAQVLTLLSFRPSFEPPWPARSHLTPLAVNRLSRRQATNMIRGVTRGVPLPAAVVERIVERTDGVPLFVEEVTKMVLESNLVAAQGGRYELTGPLTDLAIPTTLQDSLMARLDRLDAGKEVAQLGAALGREFHYELLRRVSLQEEPRLHAGLAQLVDAELLYQRGTPPEATYSFKHALIQETAYQSLLKSVRQQFHARVARVLAERFPEVAANQPELVARHYTEGGLGIQAIDYWYIAGQRAVQSSANLEAISYLDKALGLLAAAPLTSERMHLELALHTLVGLALMACKGYGAPEVEAAFRRARELCDELGAAAQPFPVLRGLWAFAIVRARLSEARALAGQLLDIARRAGDDALLLEAYYALGCTLFYIGEPRASLTWSEQGIALYDPALHRPHTQLYGADPGVTCHCYAAIVLWQLGHPDQALVRVREARTLAAETAQPVNVAFALTFGAIVHQVLGEVEAAHAWVEETISLATEQILPFWASLARIIRGWAWCKTGSSERGIAEIERGLAENRAAGAEVGRPQNCALLAEALTAKGDPAAGLAALAEAFDAVAATGARYHEAELHRLRGEILLTQTPQGGGDPLHAEAEACFRSGIEVACRQEARALELRSATSLARLWQRQGKRDQARALLAPVYAWFTEGFDTRDLMDAKALLEELS